MSNDEIIRLIAKIRDRYDQLQEPSGNIARIDVDLLQADIRELYEKISLIRLPQPVRIMPEPEKSQPEIRMEETPPMVETVSESEFLSGPVSQEHKEQQAPEDSFFAEPPRIEEENMKSEFTPGPVSQEHKEQQAPEDSFSAEPLRIEEEKVNIPAPPVPEPAPHIQETHTPVHSTFDLFGAPSQTLADKFRNEKRSISEKFGVETSADKSLGSKLRLKITDLHSAIGINDRFIFINELFEGDMRMYDEMLGHLNTCNSIEQALDVFNRAKSTQGWSNELNSVERLLDFIHRRYA